jgi:hypothetical protein
VSLEFGVQGSEFSVHRQGLGCFNHEVVAAQSPRLLYSATLGMAAIDLRNPNGVAPGLHVESTMNSTIDHDSRQIDPTGYAGTHGHNPGGVGKLAAVCPRVAEYSNPGLEDGSPSGKMSKLQYSLRLLI